MQEYIDPARPLSSRHLFGAKGTARFGHDVPDEVNTFPGEPLLAASLRRDVSRPFERDEWQIEEATDGTGALAA